MNAHSPAIILHDVTTGYHSRGGNIEITRHIEAILRTSELTCLLGPNGAGKSTLLKTLASFIPPLHGGITIADRPLRDYSAGRLARTIGVVLTEKPSLNNMTVRELVGLGRSPYTGFWGKYTREDREIVDRALQLTGITEFAARQIQTLSDGERQKVMIAKSLAQQTPIILLDEPTAFLDYPSKVEIMQLLQRMAHEEGKAVFLSTHDLELALQISDKIWLMIGKAVKLAEGHTDTHSGNVVMNRDFLIGIAREAGCSPGAVEKIAGIRLARELWTVLEEEDARRFFSRILELCHAECRRLFPRGRLEAVLVSDSGEIPYRME